MSEKRWARRSDPRRTPIFYVVASALTIVMVAAAAYLYALAIPVPFPASIILWVIAMAMTFCAGLVAWVTYGPTRVPADEHSAKPTASDRDRH